MAKRYTEEEVKQLREAILLNCIDGKLHERELSILSIDYAGLWGRTIRGVHDKLVELNKLMDEEVRVYEESKELLDNDDFQLDDSWHDSCLGKDKESRWVIEPTHDVDEAGMILPPEVIVSITPENLQKIIVYKDHVRYYFK